MEELKVGLVIYIKENKILSKLPGGTDKKLAQFKGPSLAKI